ncbi:MAG: rhodanese-like domain-containing protein [Deltaproteobacteria bacterium]|nr:rhodanese-like domain-containing protein [Deltaproteobacteria bacterium]
MARFLTPLLTALLLSAACGGTGTPRDARTEDASDAPVEIPDGPCPTGERLVVTDVTVHDLYIVTLEPDPYVLVEVSEVDETLTGIIEGTVVMPFMSGGLADDHETLPDDRPIYVICRNGTRSGLSAQYLVDHGHLCVYNVLDGIDAWNAADYPTVTP